MTIRSIPTIALLSLTLLPALALAADSDKTTLVKPGDQAPDFTCQTISGDKFTLSQQKGKVVLINFFATWCGPCQAELPHLQKDIYQKYAHRPDFKLIVIGREHTAEQLKRFARQTGLDLPFAPDPKRAIYGKYASMYVPRNFIVGRDGKVKLAETGYSDDTVQNLVKAIQKQLDRSPTRQTDAAAWPTKPHL